MGSIDYLAFAKSIATHPSTLSTMGDDRKLGTWPFPARTIGLLLLLPLLLYGGPSAADMPSKPVETFDAAKILARDQVYFDRRITFYCSCYFSPTGKSGGAIDRGDCGYVPRNDNARAQRLEWEHVVPASRIAGHRSCWKRGHPLCMKSGKPYKGRSCCEKTGVDDEARFAINDLHNLVPSVGEINGDRGNLPYGIVEGEPRAYGACDFEVGGSPKVAEPREEIRGNVARIWLYMAETWDFQLDDKELEMFERWGADDDVSLWERIRDERIGEIQGNRNSLIGE